MTSLVLSLSLHLLARPALVPVVVGVNPWGPVVLSDHPDGGSKPKKKKRGEDKEED